MIKYIRILSLFVLSAGCVLTLLTCSKRIVYDADDGVSIRFNVGRILGNLTQIYKVTITADDIDSAIVVKLNKNGDMLTGRVDNIPVGFNRLFLLEALDIENTTIYAGEGLFEVTTDVPVNVNVPMYPVVPLMRFSPGTIVTQDGSQFFVDVRLYNINDFNSSSILIPYNRNDLFLDGTIVGDDFIEEGYLGQGYVEGDSTFLSINSVPKTESFDIDSLGVTLVTLDFDLLVPSASLEAQLISLSSGAGTSVDSVYLDNVTISGATGSCPQASFLIQAANDSLGRQLNRVIDETLANADSSFRPGDIDFTGVHELYETALALCPTNNDALFGSAFTGLLSFLADPELNDLADRFKRAYDTLTFNPFGPGEFIPTIGIGKSLFPTGIPLTGSGFIDALPAFSALDRIVVKTALADPVISDIQNNFEEKLLPLLESAEANLRQILESTPDYKFIVTPEMQGNIGASPIEIDQSDLRVFLATTYAAEASLHIFFARDLDISPYTLASLETALSQTSGSNFLGLRPGGADNFTAAKLNILAAEAELQLALSSLIAEVGTDQSNDLIPVFSRDLSDLNLAKDTLARYRDFFNGSRELQIIWTDFECIFDEFDNCIDVIAVIDTITLDVDISKFFDNPMDNYKNFLPGYTLTFDELVEPYKQYAAEHFSRDQYWQTLTDIYGIVEPDDTLVFQFHLPEINDDTFYLYLSLSSNFFYRQFIFGWNDVVFNEFCFDLTDPFCYRSDNLFTYACLYRNRFDDLFNACYEWDAPTFSQWNWPDPTFNGLLPNMTSMKIRDILYDDPAQWIRGECETFPDDCGDISTPPR